MHTFKFSGGEFLNIITLQAGVGAFFVLVQEFPQIVTRTRRSALTSVAGGHIVTEIDEKGDGRHDAV